MTIAHLFPLLARVADNPDAANELAARIRDEVGALTREVAK